MNPASGDFYSPREIAAATGVPEADVVAALGGLRQLVGHADAVRIGRHLAAASFPNTPAGHRQLASWLDRLPRDRDAWVFFNNDPGGAAVIDAGTMARMARRRGFHASRTP